MFNEIVAFLMPHFFDEETRKAMVLNAFYNSEVILGKINTTGSASQFVPRLVRVLQHYGEVTPGTQALWQFLLTVRGQVGPDMQQKIDTFQAWANTPHPVPLQNDDLLLPAAPPASAPSNIRIGGNVTGGNVNIGGTQIVHGNVTVTVGDLRDLIQQGAAALTEKQILQNTVDDLTLFLKSVPAARKAEADKVASRTEELVRAVSAAPIDTEAVEGKAGLLKMAADKLKDALPEVAHHADRIVTQALRMAEI